MAGDFSFYDGNIKYIKGVGEKRAKLFSKLDVHNVYDLLHFYPRSYIDFSKAVLIADVAVDEMNCVIGTVCSPVSESYVRKNLVIFKLKVMDETGVLNLTIFNNRYLAESLTEGEKYFFVGKISEDYNSYQMQPQIVEKFRDDLFFSPVYHLTAGINSRTVEKIEKNALAMFRQQNPSDPIPEAVRNKFRLCHEQFGLNAIHFPKNEEEIKTARRRFIFEELFLLQCGMLSIKSKTKKQRAPVLETKCIASFAEALHFELTGAQKRVINECSKDLMSGRPMNRLVQGDVGSGKTAVAAALMFCAAKNGLQSAMMAPTEILAQQHYDTLKKMMSDEIGIALLTGSVSAKKKREIKEQIACGEIDIVVGTHAVITDDVAFKALALCVIDEQHRFGVRQRSALTEKGKGTHVLVMSATPIPRTLSLIIYGELDVSVIDEMPKGRQKISTYFVSPSYEERIYGFIRKHLQAGRQAYIVCPLVEESDDSELTSAIEYSEYLQDKVFPDFSVGLLHGKMKGKEKDKVMEGFSSGSIDLLVSTTVIEVGIDVPNSVVMFIRDADRFGLSQLHQLRGRVGRGAEASYCILMSSNMSESVEKRMRLLCRTDNGFEIAEEDLKIRGPGEFIGSKQSGLPALKIASFADDLNVVRAAADAAQAVFKADPFLRHEEHSALRDAVKRIYERNASTAFN